MTITAFVSGGAAPGVTTTTAALAAAWTQRVLLVDADPTGGDLLPGWLSQWLVDGEVSREHNLVSFATATRHLPAESLPAEALVGHVQVVPTARHVRLLAGVTDRAETHSLDESAWQRLATACRDLTTGGGPDVLIDLGRLGPDTPWALLGGADRVLVGVRSTLRHLTSAAAACRALSDVGDRLALAACAGEAGDAEAIERALDLPIAVDLPHDPGAARIFSDGVPAHRHALRTRLGRAAATAVRTLHTHARQAHLVD
jgi:MinD-like ATPase involved in chromosome partitioning or flagellar assembly